MSESARHFRLTRRDASLHSRNNYLIFFETIPFNTPLSTVIPRNVRFIVNTRPSSFIDFTIVGGDILRSRRKITVTRWGRVRARSFWRRFDGRNAFSAT